MTVGHGDGCCGSIPYSSTGAQICCDGKLYTVDYFFLLHEIYYCVILQKLPVTIAYIMHISFELQKIKKANLKNVGNRL